MPHKIKTFQSPTHNQETTQLRPKSHKKPPSTKSTRSNSATNLQKIITTIIIPAESATGNDGDRRQNKPIKNPEWDGHKESVNQCKRKKGKRSKSGAAGRSVAAEMGWERGRGGVELPTTSKMLPPLLRSIVVAKFFEKFLFYFLLRNLWSIHVTLMAGGLWLFTPSLSRVHFLVVSFLPF